MSLRRDVGSFASSRARAPRLRCLYRTVGLACNRGSRTVRSTFLPGEGSPMTKQDFVVSGDGHLLEPVDLFKARLPEHLRDRAVWEEDFALDEPWVEADRTSNRLNSSN